MDNTNKFIKDQEQVNELEQSGGADFWNIVKWLFIALAIAVGVAIIIALIFFFFFQDFTTGLCKNSLFYGALSIVPIIIELVGYALIAFGIGIPIVGLGMFLEIFTILCDFLRKEPGWQWDVGLGIFGLIPVVGLLGNFGKLGKKAMGFFKKGKKVV